MTIESQTNYYKTLSDKELYNVRMFALKAIRLHVGASLDIGFETLLAKTNEETERRKLGAKC